MKFWEDLMKEGHLIDKKKSQAISRAGQDVQTGFLIAIMSRASYPGISYRY
jgi:hypothetical protein